MTICSVSEPIAAVLQAHKRRHGWTYRAAATALETSEQNVHRWTMGKQMPERSWAPSLARFLHVSEQEILDAMNESDRQREAARAIQIQIELMRLDQQRLNAELAGQREENRDLRAQVEQVNALLAELQRRLDEMRPEPDQP